MRTRTYCRLFFFLVSCFLSGYTLAVDYHWTVTGASGTYVSPQSACEARAQYRRTAGYPNASFVSVTKSSDMVFLCTVSLTGDGQNLENINTYRGGDGCTSPATYNEATGVCEAPAPPPPECPVGELFPAKGSEGPVVTTSDGRNYVVSVPLTACYNQCVYSDPSARPSSCYGVPGGQGWCNFVVKSTGENCTAESYTFAQSGPQLNPSDTPNVPDSDPNDPVCPKGWSNSNGTCFKDPPKYCDPSTGEVCAPGTTDPANPPPEGGYPQPPTGEGEGGGDGGTGGGTGDSGADAALPDALPEGEACKPKADGSGCDGPTVKGEDCELPLVCTGDAIMCASLRQQKDQRCLYEQQTDYKLAKPVLDKLLTQDQYDLPETQIAANGTGLFGSGGFSTGSRFFSSSCPTDRSFYLSTVGRSVTLSYGPLCDFASALSYLVVAMASLFFIVYVGRSFGGE